MKKRGQIDNRRRHILKLLAARPGGQAGYNYLTEQLNKAGHKVGEKSVRNDCRHLFRLELARKIKKGAVITQKGKDFLESEDPLHHGVREKVLKQMAVLKLLYAAEAGTGAETGLSCAEISRHEGMGGEDSVRDLLAAMEEEGLVRKKGDKWQLGAAFPRPVPIRGDTARLLFEYLNTVSCLASLPPELAALKGKLVPVLMMPRRDRWKEELAKVVDRIAVHGRNEGDCPESGRVIAMLRDAVLQRRAITAGYLGRKVKLFPLSIVYHWEKRLWYVIAFDPANGKTTDYRADKLEGVKTGTETLPELGPFDPGEYLANRWGISSDSETLVRVRFKNTPWHLIALNKVKGDVSRRRIYHPECRLEMCPDGSVLLRDKVVGLSEFAAWLRSYGDAAEVLEPESLRRMMARTGRRMLERYGEEG